MDCCDIFSLSFSILFFIFQNYICPFFLMLSWLRIWFCNFFLWNIVDCYSVSPHGFFPSKIIFILFYFLILRWLKITVTIFEESTIIFLKITVNCYSVFSHMVFFIIFFKLSFLILFFLILSCLWITITSHYK
jgi:hypothetical protein